MDTEHLYRVKEGDLERLRKILTECFADDPLYHTLIPNDAARKRLLPELFSCDLTEFFQTCEIYGDSPELNGLLVVADETEHYHALHNWMTQLKSQILTDGYLIREDPSLQTFWNFVLGKDYLNSRWTDQLHQTDRIHIIYLAVAPLMQHHGLAEKLMNEVIRYAQSHKLMISLETHNPHNVPIYEHFGFKLYGVVKKKSFDLEQFCMVWEPKADLDI